MINLLQVLSEYQRYLKTAHVFGGACGKTFHISKIKRLDRKRCGDPQPRDGHRGSVPLREGARIRHSFTAV